MFAVNTNGTGFTNLHSFTAISAPYYTNNDGVNPQAGLILSGNNLYGTAYGGGSSGKGTVFALTTDGTSFTNLHSFTNGSDGATPYAGLILLGNTLYGTAQAGGSSDNGIVFAVNTNGTGFTNLHSFAAENGTPFTNSEGANPEAGLILSGNTLYGTAYGGGSSGIGTVFKINTDGTGFSNLHSFTGQPSDGNYPASGLILSGSTLYGTAQVGGSLNYGTVFAVNTNGTGFTNLYSFTGGSNGASPNAAGVILSGNALYGTTAAGGSSQNGTVFAVNTDGSGFTNLYRFTTTSNATNSDGSHPFAGVILSGNTLYGTAHVGGSSGSGTVFSLSLPPPPLTIIRSAANVILTWPTYAPGITLQSTTNVAPAVWSSNPPSPVLVNGQNAVTNPITGTHIFYRLIGN